MSRPDVAGGSGSPRSSRSDVPPSSCSGSNPRRSSSTIESTKPSRPHRSAPEVPPVDGTTTAPPDAPPAPSPLELARGEFVSLDHGTSGTARVLELADGSRIVRLEGLDTSNGPDLYLYLSTNAASGRRRSVRRRRRQPRSPQGQPRRPELRPRRRRRPRPLRVGRGLVRPVRLRVRRRRSRRRVAATSPLAHICPWGSSRPEWGRRARRRVATSRDRSAKSVFARSVGSQVADDLPPVLGEAQVVERVDGPEVLAQPLRAHCGVTHRPFLRSAPSSRMPAPIRDAITDATSTASLAASASSAFSNARPVMNSDTVKPMPPSAAAPAT